MANRFDIELHPQDVRWAAAEGVSQDVIAAVLLLHERSVDEIASQLGGPELEQVIMLPRLSAMKLDGGANNPNDSWAGATADELRAEINRRLTVLQEAGIIELQVIGAPEAR
jgi:hypothetical protein